MSIISKLIPYINKLDSFIDIKRIQIESKLFLLSGGFTCSICGSKHLHFKNQEAVGHVTNPSTGVKTRMILSWSMGDSIVCPLCALDFIGKYFTENDNIGDCDFTGVKNTQVCDIIYSDTKNPFNLRFGREWWNGFSASHFAIYEAIRSCTMKSGIVSYNDGKVLYYSGKNLVPTQTFDEWIGKQTWQE
jgi:hypothetical protein